jgi:hypothetical protein
VFVLRLGALFYWRQIFVHCCFVEDGSSESSCGPSLLDRELRIPVFGANGTHNTRCAHNNIARSKPTGTSIFRLVRLMWSIFCFPREGKKKSRSFSFLSFVLKIGKVWRSERKATYKLATPESLAPDEALRIEQHNQTHCNIMSERRSRRRHTKTNILTLIH